MDYLWWTDTSKHQSDVQKVDLSNENKHLNDHQVDIHKEKPNWSSNKLGQKYIYFFYKPV